jgi:hypothetical protein
LPARAFFRLWRTEAFGDTFAVRPAFFFLTVLGVARAMPPLY